MSQTTVYFFSFSILIATVIGWDRFERIDPAYYPFLYILSIGLLNEVVSVVLVSTGHHSAINNNIYAFFEPLFIFWLFKNLGIFERANYLFVALLLIVPLIWFIENFFIVTITQYTFYYRIFYSFVIVLISIHTINSLIMTERKNLIKNSIFLLCVGFVIYYTFSVLVQAFWLYGLNVSRDFTIKVIAILLFINLFANLIYALAVLWMPTRHRFTLPY